MKFAEEQGLSVIVNLSVIPFFPSEPLAHMVILKQMERFVGGDLELDWLIEAAINTMRKWEGIPELRGLYCTRFKPQDGVEAICSLPGYSPAEQEARVSLALSQGPGMRLLEAPADCEAEEAIVDLAGVPSSVLIKRLPVPTKADREYSKKLLEGVGL